MSLRSSGFAHSPQHRLRPRPALWLSRAGGGVYGATCGHLRSPAGDPGPVGFAGLVLRAAVAVGAGTQRSATASHPEGRHPPSVPTRGVGRVGASQNLLCTFQLERGSRSRNVLTLGTGSPPGGAQLKLLLF